MTTPDKRKDWDKEADEIVATMLGKYSEQFVGDAQRWKLWSKRVSNALRTAYLEGLEDAAIITKAEDNRCYANQGSATAMQYKISQAIRTRANEVKNAT